MHVCLTRTAAAPSEGWSIRSAHQFCEATSGLLDLPIISGPHVMALQGGIYAMAMMARSHVWVHLDKRNLIAHLDLCTPIPGVEEEWKEKGRQMFGDADA